LGKQKLVNNNQDNQIQSIYLCNYVYAEAGEFLRIFVLKVTLQFVRLLLTVSYRKKNGGTGCILVAPPNNFVGGTTAASASPPMNG